MPEYGGNILCEQGFRNIGLSGETDGFQVRVLISYYRGVPFSMIDSFTVEVDGQSYGPDLVSFSIDGTTFHAMAELGSHIDDVWEFGVKAYLHILKAGGLSGGLHTVKVTERINVPYLPFTTESSQTKKMTLVV
jgi:hypothetical protein